MDLVRDNVWQTCVTPNRIQAVKAILIERETQHWCTVKLLPLFFSRDELSRGNTNGSRKMLLISSNPNKIQQLPQNNVGNCKIWLPGWKCSVSRPEKFPSFNFLLKSTVFKIWLFMMPTAFKMILTQRLEVQEMKNKTNLWRCSIYYSIEFSEV